MVIQIKLRDLFEVWYLFSSYSYSKDVIFDEWMLVGLFEKNHRTLKLNALFGDIEIYCDSSGLVSTL